MTYRDWIFKLIEEHKEVHIEYTIQEFISAIDKILKGVSEDLKEAIITDGYKFYLEKLKGD